LTSGDPPASAEIVYEVTLHVDAAIADEYDAWLAAHAAEILRLPGFLSAEIFEGDGGGELPMGEIERVVHYRLRDRTALESYFRGHAGRMRDDGERRFGGRFTATRRILSSRGPDR
jgi:Domain of unknown function (DUF4286)